VEEAEAVKDGITKVCRSRFGHRGATSMLEVFRAGSNEAIAEWSTRGKHIQDTSRRIVVRREAEA
jgi:hypothetical protein